MKAVILAADRALCRVIEALAIALLVTVACLCFYQVLARFLLEEPSTWTEVLSRTLTVWTVYLGAYVLFRNGSLISVDLLHRKASGWLREALDVLHLLASLTVLSTAFVFGIQLAWRVRHQVLAGLGFPVGLAYAAIPIGALLAILGALAAYLARRRRAPVIE